MTWLNESVLSFLVQHVTSTNCFYKGIDDNWTQMDEIGLINSVHKGLMEEMAEL